jgi:hypothetical protein
MAVRAAVAAVALTLLAIPVSGHQAPPAGASATAKISGRVTAVDTGRPIRRATLRLVSYEVMRQARTAVTDDDGRFEFAGLLAGRYQLNAAAERYLGLEFGQRRPPEPGRPIDLAEGQQFTNADLSLPRASAIEGVVVDEFGDPVPNISVVIYRSEFVAGRRRLMPLGNPAGVRPTDDKGQFRLSGLTPGDYYVGAMSGVFTESNETGGFAPTFLPGVIETASATPVRLGFGDTASNLKLALVPAAMGTMSGKLVDPAGQPIGGGTILLTPSERSSAQVFHIARSVSDRDGSFTLRNVPAGSYTIQAFGRPQGGGNLARAPFGWLTLAIDGQHLRDLRVTVTPGTVARGRIAFEGEATPPRPTEVRISAGPVDFESSPVAGGPSNTVTRDDWTFEVQNMNGRRVMRADVASSVWTLKRVTLNGIDVTDTPVDFREQDVNGIDVLLTSRTASVEGSVVETDGKASTNYSVVIFSTVKEKWTFPSRYIALARPNQAGQFRVAGLPPETYLAIALPAVQGMDYQDPEFLEAQRGLATLFTLAEGERKTLDLKIVRR